MLVKAGMVLALYQQGFISVSIDEFARGLQNIRWSLHPTLSAAADLQSVWLPFEKYLNGSLFWLWPDVIWLPRLTVFLSSCLLLVVLFLLIRTFFKPPAIAYLALLFVSFQPWQVWLSGTPMIEMYYLPCFFGGIFFLVNWLKDEQKKGYWVWAGVCFCLANGLHVQAWTFVNLVFLMSVGYWGLFVWRKAYGRCAQLTAVYLLGDSYILFYAITEYRLTGTIFAFLHNHTVYSSWYYHGYNAGIQERLLFYPRLVIVNNSLGVWVLLALAVGFLLFDKERWGKLFLLGLGILALALNSTLNVFSVPPTAAPDRYSLFYTLLLAPYLAYGSYQLIHWGWQSASRWQRPLTTFLGVGLLGYSVAWGLLRIPHFPPAMSWEAVETGQALKTLLDQAEANGAETPGYMVELTYWEYIGVQLPAWHYEAIYFDRPYDFYKRDTPSMLIDQPEKIRAEIETNHIQYVALHSDDLEAKAGETGFLHSVMTIGDWTIFRFEP